MQSSIIDAEEARTGSMIGTGCVFVVGFGFGASSQSTETFLEIS